MGHWKQMAWWVRKRAPVPNNDGDAAAITRHAPELHGLSRKQTSQYIADRLRYFRQSCSSLEASVLDVRLSECRRSWEAQGAAMPEWSALVVLRELQADIAAQEPLTKGPWRKPSRAVKSRPLL
jgi:hypothetical protein